MCVQPDNHTKILQSAVLSKYSVLIIQIRIFIKLGGFLVQFISSLPHFRKAIIMKAP